jgi:enoyl-CoA hydratase/carnithine racemase
MAGEKIEAEEALAMGLIDRIVEAEALMQTARTLQIPTECRLVQTKLFFHGRQGFWGGSFAQNNLCGIAGQPLKHPKHDHRRDSQGDEKTKQALEHKGRHALSL